MEVVCTACGHRAPAQAYVHPCPRCREPVEVRYAPGEIDPLRAVCCAGPREGVFADFDAVLPRLPGARVSLGEGGTPLVRLPRIGAGLGIDGLFLKDEGQNPTGSFKDRGTAVALTWALGRGYAAAGTVSSGNMAASVAAYAARAGLPCAVLVPAHLRPEKIFTIAVYGPELIRVEGDYGELYRKALELGPELGVYFAVSDDPWRVEGQKTTMYEIVRDLGGQPDFVFVPTSAGGHMSGILKAVREMKEAGAAGSSPQVVGVQALGCSPIASAFQRGATEVVPFDRPDTAAHAISNPDPPSGSRVLRALSSLGGGGMVAVSDEEMKAAQRALAEEEGLFVQMESAASLAGATAYRRRGLIPGGARVVLVGTGSGLKDPGAFSASDFPSRLTGLAGLPDTLAAWRAGLK